MSSDKVPYTLTNESITVVWDKKPYVVTKGAPNFNNLRKAIITAEETGDWSGIEGHLSVKTTVRAWSNNKFDVMEDSVTYEGQPVPGEFARHVLERAQSGQSPEPLFKFWERLQKNPSKRSVDQLFPFLAKENIPITEDGCFLAYKGVRHDYYDQHSGTILNKPGSVIEIPRNHVSDDPNQACHYGLHVGSVSYAKGFAPRVVICKVDPEHVVCVPYDCSQQKMRVCKYEVIGNYGDDLPSSLFESDEMETVREDEKNIEEVVVEEIDTSNQARGVSEEAKKKTPPKAVRTEKKLDKREYKDFDKMDAQELMSQSIDALRKYATYGLEIVGASKIPGGKATLVSKILKVRKKK